MSASPETQDAVLTERRDGVLLVTLNRPDARNAVNRALAEGVAAALDELDGTPELRVGILTGAGRGFCAGHGPQGLHPGEAPYVAGRGFAGIVQRPPDKPLIAAIEGFAVAGGLRDRARLRPDRRGARGARSGSPRSSAASSPPPARCCACRAGSRTTSRWSSP